MMEKRVELLAPCGGYESFLAAVNAGADAVYLGGREFGARAYAENFSEEELTAVIGQAHLFGVKVYLTVNTLVKEREFSKIYDYMLPLYKAGLDGVIVQDVGVLGFLKKHFPALKFHASTQMTITGIYGASYLKKAGCERIVPARELSLEEIRSIKEKVPVEIEAFIHGAMCYCYSGQCLMSSMIGGRSGNRGRCAGPCRLPYRTAGKEGFFLSLKDMNTLEHIPELIEAGIDSFKIEGRMKKPEYVAGVVSVYRKYIDKYYQECSVKSGSQCDGSKNIVKTGCAAEQECKEGACRSEWRVDLKDKQILSDLYLRSETGTGYYFTGRGKEMLTLEKPGYNETDPTLLESLRKAYIHELPKKALSIQVQCKAGEPLYMEGRLSDFMGKSEFCISVSGPVAERADRRPVSREEIEKQLVKTGGTPFAVENCSIVLSENAFVPMKWIKQLRRDLLQKIYEACGSRDMERRTEEDRQECRELVGLENDRNSVEWLKEKNAWGQKRSSEAENLQEFQKSGNQEGRQNPENCARKEKSCDLIIMVQKRQQFEAVISAMEREETGTNRANAEDKQAETIKKTLIVDADLLLEDSEIRDRLGSKKINWGIKCPTILRKSDEAFLKRLQAVIEELKPDVLYCGTIDVLAWVKSIPYQGKIAGEASLYAWNKEAVSFWEKELDSISIPLELDSKEIRELCMAVGKREAEKKVGELQRFGRLEAPVYGRAPFMVSANCIKLSSGQCDKNRERYTRLTDRMGNTFPVYTNCSHCYNIIYNCLPTSCHENLWMLLQDGIRAFQIEFTTEDGVSAGEVLKTFCGILASELQEKDEKKKASGGNSRNHAEIKAAKREKSKDKGDSGRMSEMKKGKIAGMETTQGRFRRPVE